jgi:hypothetical protein
VHQTLTLCISLQADRISWTIWLYKVSLSTLGLDLRRSALTSALLQDIGIQGLVHAKTDSPWIKLFGAAIARKRKIAMEFWGTDE